MPKNFFRWFFLFFGSLDLIATGTAFFLSLSVMSFFFSYFTVLSNILITALFLYFGIFNPKKSSKTLQWIYGAGVLYMTITGIIYWSILVNAHSLSLDPWINLTMHGVMPIAAFVSWIIVSRGKKLIYKSALEWLVPPLIFVFYTLIHGVFIKWYPYPFFNPITSGGYIKVGINVFVIIIGAWAIGLILIWIKNRKNVS